jgi:hypothetical protein
VASTEIGVVREMARWLHELGAVRTPKLVSKIGGTSDRRAATV